MKNSTRLGKLFAEALNTESAELRKFYYSETGGFKIWYSDGKEILITPMLPLFMVKSFLKLLADPDVEMKTINLAPLLRVMKSSCEREIIEPTPAKPVSKVNTMWDGFQRN